MATQVNTRSGGIDIGPREIWLAAIGAASLARRQARRVACQLLEQGRSAGERASRVGDAAVSGIGPVLEAVAKRTGGFRDALAAQVASPARGTTRRAGRLRNRAPRRSR